MKDPKTIGAKSLAKASPGEEDVPSGALRIDKWLWFARFFKTRGLAVAAIQEGNVLRNGVTVSKLATPVHPGDRLTLLFKGKAVRVAVLALGTRRGTAEQAQSLYQRITAFDA